MTTTLSTTSNANALPLNVVASLPPKDSAQSSSTCTSTPPTKSTTQARLLYRGALSLPDSHLLLDGLTFTIALPSDDPHAGRTLLETPLPLALESMRGRPSLRFGGIVKMEDVHCDFSERVNLHVHPRCILTRQLFEYTLCTTPVSPSKGHTDSGIRISLGDASNTNTNNNDIVVFGRPHPSSSVMQLCVARILPPPPPKPFFSSGPGQTANANEKAAATHQTRPPRPDDPTPRKPPAGYAGIARIGLGMKRTPSVMKLKDSSNEEREMIVGEGFENANANANKRQKKEKEKDGTSRSSLKSNSQGSFKVPALPPGKARTSRTSSEVDVFDTPMEVDRPARASDQETKNKTFIKKAVVRLLSAAGVSKTNPSYKDFYNQVYHGTAFALRAKLGTTDLEANTQECELVDRIAQAHITLYLGGLGVGVMLLQQG